jgi:hypothetical protein
LVRYNVVPSGNTLTEKEKDYKLEIIFASKDKDYKQLLLEHASKQWTELRHVAWESNGQGAGII